MRAIAVYDCVGDDPTELTFSSGQTIIDVSEAEDQGWYKGRVEGTSVFGVFPGNYVRFEEDPVEQHVNIPARGATRVQGVEGLPGPNLLSAKLQPVDAARPMSSLIVKGPAAGPTLPGAYNLTKEPIKSEIPDWTRNAFAPRKPKIDAMATRQALMEKSTTLAVMAREKTAASRAPSNVGTVNSIAASFGGTTGAAAQPSRSFSGSSSSSTSSVATNVAKFGVVGGPTLSHSTSASSLTSRSVSAGGSPALPRRPPMLQSNLLAQPPSTPPRNVVAEPEPESGVIETSGPKSVAAAAKAFEAAANANSSYNSVNSSVIFGGMPLKKTTFSSVSAPAALSTSNISSKSKSITSPSSATFTVVSSSATQSFNNSNSSNNSDTHNNSNTTSTSTPAPNHQPVKKEKPAPPPSRPVKPAELKSGVRQSTVAAGNTTSNSADDIPDDAKTRYEDVFQRYDANNEAILSGDEVRTIWMRSGLDPPTLGQIWVLADVDEDGALTKEEFCIGMFLIDERLRGVEIPDRLPENLIKYAMHG
ncbi:hypothetical protein SmJEL517_g00684 [Synchytrium microbalum]|uniref:SH3 domain-containing protein n=1 Tax=Synchytrium microbalum TaxID=1806994 RepID=A0A507CHD3_9FUNG|nr:uncharacterized protein SmJEL517_g00684 [Synchytrium microbalum]TPX37434.1 hypothetical protein SmJEL517_g00684 [Synchytrium microbalum]